MSLHRIHLFISHSWTYSAITILCRSTLPRAVQRVVRSCVEWGALVEAGRRGHLAAGPRLPVADARVAPWLLEAALVGSGRREYPLRDLLGSAFLFPFDVALPRRDLASNPRLELCRQGLDEDVVVLK